MLRLCCTPWVRPIWSAETTQHPERLSVNEKGRSYCWTHSKGLNSLWVHVLLRIPDETQKPPLKFASASLWCVGRGRQLPTLSSDSHANSSPTLGSPTLRCMEGPRFKPPFPAHMAEAVLQVCLSILSGKGKEKPYFTNLKNGLKGSLTPKTEEFSVVPSHVDYPRWQK